MYRVCTEADRALVLDYISTEPEMSLFIGGGIEQAGFDGSCTIFAFSSDKGSSLSAVLMRRGDHFTIYSRDDFFDRDEVAKLIKEEMEGRAPGDINGAARTVKYFSPFFPDNRWEPCTLASCHRVVQQTAEALPDGVTLGVLSPQEIDEWLALLCSCEELSIDASDIDDLAVRRTRKLEDMATGLPCVVARDEAGHILSTASFGTASTQGAMVIAVATNCRWRGKGLASAAVAHLCDLGFSLGMRFVALFFDNPAAGHIYHRLGFEDIGQFAMLRR